MEVVFLPFWLVTFLISFIGDSRMKISIQIAANEPKARPRIIQSCGLGGVIFFKNLKWLRKLNINARGRRVGEHKAPVSQTQDQGLLFELALISHHSFVQIKTNVKEKYKINQTYFQYRTVFIFLFDMLAEQVSWRSLDSRTRHSHACKVAR